MFAEVTQVVTNLVWLVVVDAVGYGYNRTESLWTAIATIFAYRAVLGYTVYVEVVSGLAPMPWRLLGYVPTELTPSSARCGVVCERPRT